MCLCVHVSIHFRRRGEEDAKCRIREGGDNAKWLDGCAGERKRKRKRKMVRASFHVQCLGQCLVRLHQYQIQEDMGERTSAYEEEDKEVGG